MSKMAKRLAKQKKKLKKKIHRYYKDLRKHPKRLRALVVTIVVGVLVVSTCGVAAIKYQDHRAQLRSEKEGYVTAQNDLSNLVLDIQGSVGQEGILTKVELCDKSPQPPKGPKYVCTVNQTLVFDSDIQTLQSMASTVDGLIQSRGDVFDFGSYTSGPIALSTDANAPLKAETFTHNSSGLGCSASYSTTLSVAATGLSTALYTLTVNLACSGPAHAKFF